MCYLCVEWEKGKLTSQEVLRNVGEMIKGEKNSKKVKHYYEVVAKVLDKEVPLCDTDEELDKIWHDKTHPED